MSTFKLPLITSTDRKGMIPLEGRILADDPTLSKRGKPLPQATESLGTWSLDAKLGFDSARTRDRRLWELRNPDAYGHPWLEPSLRAYITRSWKLAQPTISTAQSWLPGAVEQTEIVLPFRTANSHIDAVSESLDDGLALSLLFRKKGPVWPGDGYAIDAYDAVQAIQIRPAPDSPPYASDLTDIIVPLTCELWGVPRAATRREGVSEVSDEAAASAEDEQPPMPDEEYQALMASWTGPSE